MNKTKVYIAKTDVLYDDVLFEKLYGAVSRARQEKADRYMFRKDKNLSIAAEMLLKKALQNEGIVNYELQYRKSGKPYIEGRDDIYFNLSHSEGVVMCAVSGDEVGCDAEKKRDIELEIAKRFFYSEEHDAIMEKETAEEKKDTFFRLWTLKESFMKVTGLGMKLPLDSFKIDISGSVPTVQQSVDDREYYFKEYDFKDGYKYAVCALSPNFNKVEFVALEEV